MKCPLETVKTFVSSISQGLIIAKNVWSSP